MWLSSSAHTGSKCGSDVYNGVSRASIFENVRFETRKPPCLQGFLFFLFRFVLTVLEYRKPPKYNTESYKAILESSSFTTYENADVLMNSFIALKLNSLGAI